MRKRGFEKISNEQFEKDFGSLNFSVNYEDIILPKRGTRASAGYDIFSPFDFALKKGGKIYIPTGIKAYMLDDEYFAMVVRSSSGFKYNIRLCNQVAIIDADYYNNFTNEGHILVALQNEGNKDWIIKKGDKIVQGIFNKYFIIDNDDAGEIVRTGGIGSTDKEV